MCELLYVKIQALIVFLVLALSGIKGWGWLSQFMVLIDKKPKLENSVILTVMQAEVLFSIFFYVYKLD